MTDYMMLLGHSSPPAQAPKAKHGNEGENWRKTPARMAQRKQALAASRAANEQRQQARVIELEGRILRALLSGPKTTAQIAALTSSARTTLHEHRVRLVTRGLILIKETRNPNGGPPMLLWRLPQ